MSLKIKPFAELSVRELYDSFKLRQDVFILEQRCLYPDIDELDLYAWHVLLYDRTTLIGYARIIKEGAWVRIGRVIAKKRHEGIGEQVMQEALHMIREMYPEDDIILDAQTYAIGFYEKQSFQMIGDVFDEDGIPHIRMIYKA